MRRRGGTPRTAASPSSNRARRGTATAGHAATARGEIPRPAPVPQTLVEDGGQAETGLGGEAQAGAQLVLAKGLPLAVATLGHAVGIEHQLVPGGQLHLLGLIIHHGEHADG